MSIEQIIFICLLLLAIGLFLKNVIKIRSNILLGKKLKINDQKGKRFKNMLLLAFGQKKMFKRPVVALLHLFVYLGFFIVNIELLEIVLDGILGTHRLFAEPLGSLYEPIINVFEFFAVAVIISCAIFLIRRNIIKVKRFQQSEMKKWPKLDGNLILIFEIVLMGAFLKLNAVDAAMTGSDGFFFSSFLIPFFKGMSSETLHLFERVFWWVHIVGVFFFANYVLYSKHLHIFLAFPNSYFGSLEPKGKMENMQSVTNEVNLMLNIPTSGDTPAPAEVGRFGAKDVTDLNWKHLLDAYSCTECGRCTDNCPANMTGKALSPRKIMMDTRDRVEELGKVKKSKGKEATDDKSLLGNYITEEEIFACTTCNACVEACPVSINPLSIITELRRFKVMEEAQGPGEWTNMYQNIETSFSPWKFPPTDRFNWANALVTPTSTNSNIEESNNTETND